MAHRLEAAGKFAIAWLEEQAAFRWLGQLFI